ncbi:hypothetical protein [Microbacterium gorillae]|uniref:hypothetical protein n=1 Tax=Microbacterium gorillae TaxID=1231063 RepID=UPI003D9597B9
MDVSRYALSLPGYEQQSIWGTDSGTMSVWAYLWRNGTDGNAPPALSVMEPTLDLAIREISDKARMDYVDVFLALAAARLDDRDELLLASLVPARGADRAWIERLLSCGIDWVEDEAREVVSYRYPDIEARIPRSQA